MTPLAWVAVSLARLRLWQSRVVLLTETLWQSRLIVRSPASLEPSDPALPRALIAVANAIKVVDRSRVWDATFDAVKAANSADGFSGEDGELVFPVPEQDTGFDQ